LVNAAASMAMTPECGKTAAPLVVWTNGSAGAVESGENGEVVERGAVVALAPAAMAVSGRMVSGMRAAGKSQG
jgi:hypothetical protein